MRKKQVVAPLLPSLTCSHLCVGMEIRWCQLIPLGRTWTTLLQQCVAACMLPATCALAWGFAYARLEGEHISHRTQSLGQQSGRCRSHSSRRSCEGNGSDVCSVVVSEHALVVATDVALQSGVNSWRRQVDIQFVLLLLRFFLFLEGKP